MKRFPVGDTYALVDDEDYDMLKALAFSWYEREGYAVTKVADAGRARRRQLSMHRVVTRENNPVVVIDHIDGNRLNNQKANLRRFTLKENANNRIDNRKIFAFGETKTVSEWVDDPRCSVDYEMLQKRFKAGVPPELAILALKGEI